MSALIERVEVKERPVLFSGPMVRAILDGRKTQTRRVIKPQPLEYKQDPNCVFVGKDGSKKVSEWFTLTHKEYVRVYTEHYYGDHWDKKKVYRSSLKHNTRNVLSIHEYMSGCPYGQPGDRLWVRETFAYVSPDENRRPHEECNIEYRADTNDKRPGGWDADPEDPDALVWKPSIFMPRKASRITLEVTNVRVERLQDISEGDAIAEGIEPLYSQEAIRTTVGLESYRFGAPVPWANYLWHGRRGGTEGYSSADNAVDSYRSLWDSINAKKYPWSSNPWVWVVSFRRLESEVPA